MQKLKSFIQKHRKLIYLLAAAVIVIISCYFGFQGQENWTSEKYGTTSDGQIAIADTIELKTTFIITEDNFKGVTVRLSTKTKKYENEKLHFYLYDKNEKLISDYVMYLRDEMYNVDVMALLPYDDSKGKEVTLYIYGEDIEKIPHLYTSINENLKSSFYVNDVKNENYLVLSAVYMTKSKINYNAVFGGLLLLGILMISYIWSINSTQKDEQSEKKSFSVVAKILNHFVCYKKIYGFFALSLLVIGLEWFVYKTYIVTYLIEQQQVEHVAPLKPEVKFALDKNNNSMKHYVDLKENEFSSFVYDVKISGSEINGKIHVNVQEKKSGFVYHDKSYKLNKLSDGKLYILMNSEFSNSKNESVIISVDLVDANDESVEFIAGKQKSSSKCEINGRNIGVSPAIQLNYSDNGYLVRFFAAFCCLIYLFFSITYYLFVIKKAEVEEVFIPVVLLLGVIYMLVVPVYTVPDEYTHIDKSYSMSNILLGINSIDSISRDYKRSEDVNNYMYTEVKLKPYMYREAYLNLNHTDINSSYEDSQARNSFGNAGKIYFISSAIGITFARLLGLSNELMLLMGRLFNVIAFTLICFFAVKIIPIGKNFLMLIICLPITLQEAASFSYDCIINAISFLFIAVFVYCLYNKKISTPAIISLMLLASLMACVKGGVYMPLCFALLLIPVEKKWNKKIVIPTTIIFIIFAYAKNNLLSILKTFFRTSSTSINGMRGGEMYTTSFLLENPDQLVTLIINTLFVKGDEYIKGFFGGILGAMELHIPLITILVSMAILVYVFMNEKYENKLSHLGKTWLTILVIGSFFLVSLSMLLEFTLKDVNYIEGVQGRYFIPIVPWIFLLMKRKTETEKDFNSFNYVFFLNHIVILSCVIMDVLGLQIVR